MISNEGRVRYRRRRSRNEGNDKKRERDEWSGKKCGGREREIHDKAVY